MRRFSGRLAVLVAALVLALAGEIGAHRTTSSTEMPATMSARHVTVIDGDTIQLGGAIVQLYGIDAPELGQRCYHDLKWSHCGLDAAYELHKLINVEHTPVTCRPAEGEADPSLRVCSVGTIDFAHVLLKSGYAVTAADTTEGYREAEAEARAAGLGLWHSQFVPPADWRAGRRLPNENPSEDPACPIKAVIGDGGLRIYHVPTDAVYQSVTVDPAKGERFFCSDEEARDAGWHRLGERAD